MNTIETINTISNFLTLNKLNDLTLNIQIYRTSVYFDLDLAPYHEEHKPTAAQVRRFKRAFGTFRAVGQPPYVSMECEKKVADNLRFVGRLMGAFVCEITATETITKTIPAEPERVVTEAKHTYSCTPVKI